MTSLIGLLPAAGRGVRAYPYTERIPKSMLAVDGVPVLRRNIELMRDELGIRDIRIVLGHCGEVIRRSFGDGSALGVDLRYIENPRIDLELPYSVLLAGRDIDSHCCMILPDECYVNSNHGDLARSFDPTQLVTLTTVTSEYKKHIRKNYVLDTQAGQIVDLIEKPEHVTSRIMGTGTYILHPEVFRRLEGAYGGDPERGPRDWTTWLAGLARRGEKLAAFDLTGMYVNINSRDDLNYANFLVRDRGFGQRRTSLVYLIEGEEEAAAGPVARFAEQPEIDEVVAVTRRLSPALESVGDADGVVLVAAPSGAVFSQLVKLGLDRASGDIFLISYSDDTFAARDVSKLLVYLRDADMVVGTRTTRQMIEQGTNMRGIVRAAHVLLAKLMQVLWWRFDSRFTDVCCVYRAMWRSTYELIRDNLTATGVEVFPEMVLEVLRARRRIIEIPVNYYNRDLEFDHVHGRYQTGSTFVRIAWLILRKRIADSRRLQRLRGGG
jgi:NDP-sugar pyrophosphorylase family protein